MPGEKKQFGHAMQIKYRFYMEVGDQKLRYGPHGLTFFFKLGRDDSTGQIGFSLHLAIELSQVSMI